MRRPGALRLFNWLFWTGGLAPILAIMLNYGSLRQAAIERGGSAGGPIASVLVSLLIDILVWWLINRRASNLARWAMVVLTGLGLINLPILWGEMEAIGPGFLVLNLLSCLCWIAACVMLFRGELGAWIRSSGAVAPVDPKTFD